MSAFLFRQPERFDFFQAVRLLEQIARERLAQGEPRPCGAVGQDVPPERELVRFRALPSLSFPASSIARIQEPPAGAEASPVEMAIAFLGLTGPQGVLPQHYTALLLQRLRDQDTSLRDFLDLFHHRLASLFYRAWEKYRLPFAHERFRLDRGERDGGRDARVPERGRLARDVDAATAALFCLVGMGTPGLRGRLQTPDEAFLFYAGHFAHQPRSAVALECLLEDYFAMPMRVEQLQGQWLSLPAEDQAQMPGLGLPEGRNNGLGVDLVVGERVWDVQSKFRLRVGPLTFAQFRRLMPNSDGLLPLCELARTYVGLELDFDVQVVLLPAEAPWCRLSSDEGEGAYLGWNTWVRNEAFDRDVEDAVFALVDI